ncbi:hypothetical protein GCM10022199_02330 [Marihabitans asiaticum]
MSAAAQLADGAGRRSRGGLLGEGVGAVDRVVRHGATLRHHPVRTCHGRYLHAHHPERTCLHTTAQRYERALRT